MPDECDVRFEPPEDQPRPGCICLGMHLPGMQGLPGRSKRHTNKTGALFLSLLNFSAYFPCGWTFAKGCVWMLGVTGVNMRLIYPSMSAYPTRIYSMGQPCTTTSSLLSRFHSRNVLNMHCYTMARSGYFWTEDDSPRPVLHLLRLLSRKCQRLILTSISTIHLGDLGSKSVTQMTFQLQYMSLPVRAASKTYKYVLEQMIPFAANTLM